MSKSAIKEFLVNDPFLKKVRKKFGRKGSLAYRANKNSILQGDIPEKYTRLLPLVPGQRVLEVGAAEGVLALLMAREKEMVYALEMSEERHQEALMLQSAWEKQGQDVSRCQMVMGDMRDRLDLLQDVDTLLAVRSIYYLQDDLLGVFEKISPHVKKCYVVRQ